MEAEGGYLYYVLLLPSPLLQQVERDVCVYLDAAEIVEDGARRATDR